MRYLSAVCAFCLCKCSLIVSDTIATKNLKLTSVAAEFNVGKSTVHDMMKNKAKLQTFLTEVQDGDCIKKRRIVRRANLYALDKAVYLWFVQQRCKEPRSVVHDVVT